MSGSSTSTDIIKTTTLNGDLFGSQHRSRNAGGYNLKQYVRLAILGAFPCIVSCGLMQYHGRLGPNLQMSLVELVHTWATAPKWKQSKSRQHRQFVRRGSEAITVGIIIARCTMDHFNFFAFC